MPKVATKKKPRVLRITYFKCPKCQRIHGCYRFGKTIDCRECEVECIAYFLQITMKHAVLKNNGIDIQEKPCWLCVHILLEQSRK